MLSCFVGLFCACMPALRKCLAKLFPSCFSSTQQNSNYNDYSNTPNGRLSSNKLGGERSKTRSGLNFSGITKTVDTNFTITRLEDDEQELVDMQRHGPKTAPSNWSVGGGSDKSDGETRIGRAA